MKLEFKINKYYLAGYAMTSKNKPFPVWEKLEEKIWQKYKIVKIKEVQPTQW